MELAYVFACGIVWRYTADTEAGWELIRALKDCDEDVQGLAAVMLADEPQNSVVLLNAAIAAGVVSGKDAADAFAGMVAKAGEPSELPVRRPPEYGPS